MKQLSHNIITFLVAAGTGAGKTLFCCLMACKEAYRILKDCIGITNTTLTNRSYVYSDNPWFKNHMVIHAKKKDEILKKIMVQSQIVRALASIIIRNKSLERVEESKILEMFKMQFEKEVNDKNNTKSVFSFIDKEDLAELAGVAAVVLSKLGIYNNSMFFYKSAEQKLKSDEVKNSTNRFKSLIADEISDVLDGVNNDNQYKATLYTAIDNINTKLEDKFFKYFEKQSITDDGFYEKILELNNSDENKEFCSAFFNKNNNGLNSIEALCEEIYIYLGMRDTIISFINSSNQIRKVFSNTKTRYCEFALYDTMGVFHKDTQEDNAIDYIDGLMRLKRFAAAIFLAPLTGDTNVEKVIRGVKKVFENLNYSTMAYIIRNNLNKYLHDIIENEYGISTMDEDNDAIDEAFVNGLINKVESSLNNDFSSFKNKYIEVEVHTTLAEFRSFDKSIQCNQELNKYSLKCVIEKLIKDYVNYDSKCHSRLQLTHVEGTQNIDIRIDYTKFRDNFIHLYEGINLSMLDKEYFVPATNNLNENIPKVPHGNAYNALVRRLERGNGYKSEIDESYYINCNSFYVSFPYKINDLATSEIVDLLLKDAIVIDGIKYDADDLAELITRLKSNISKGKISKLMVYDYALKDAEKNNGSFKSCFRKFIEKCKEFVDIEGRIKNKELWVESLFKVYSDALEYTFNYSIYIN